MRIVRINGAGQNYEYGWPEGPEVFGYYVDYVGVAEDGEHDVRIGFGKRRVYGKERVRVVIWIDKHPHAEFFGADDFEKTGNVLSELKVAGRKGERICRYPGERVPERYVAFHVVGLPVRVKGPRVRGAWGILANVGDHRTMIALAGLRRLERMR